MNISTRVETHLKDVVEFSNIRPVIPIPLVWLYLCPRLAVIMTILMPWQVGSNNDLSPRALVACLVQELLHLGGPLLHRMPEELDHAVDAVSSIHRRIVAEAREQRRRPVPARTDDKGAVVVRGVREYPHVLLRG